MLFIRVLSQSFRTPTIPGRFTHRVINASNSNIDLSCDIFYLDNAMHSGASGGPVINKSGDAVGIITQRAVTSASQKEAPSLSIPSGSTVAISIQPLKAVRF